MAAVLCEKAVFVQTSGDPSWLRDGDWYLIQYEDTPRDRQDRDSCLRYLADGKLRAPLHFQFVLGAPYGMPATAASLVYLTGLIPGDATWSVIGIGRAQTPMAALAIAMGGHARGRRAA